ncbi:DUF2357 domain-containing protein [Chitinophaga sp. SYP-B3965]|uniref:DUF2357 domain-containing protein n=1 Tax=Chitinophaga sp. SYP-B3965 TaxID=2663120 RepID=UPI0012997170|nr:DUF2357 domain-containing protein [Chitinophaga sp. SYP-B3965]MRG44261.1 DUF2357 domain-containing protein [Chitinophaga sp. SYP-B3965]
MKKDSIIIHIKTNKDDVVKIEIVQDSTSNKSPIWEIDDAEAYEFGEATIQISEGCSYEYIVTKGYHLGKISGVIHPSKFNSNTGRITPNIYVGTLDIAIYDSKENENCGTLSIEVKSTKISYREDYRKMLQDITEKCTDLLMQPNSPAQQWFTPDYTKKTTSLYQQFAFIKSILNSEEFNNSIHAFLAAPVTSWSGKEIEKDIRNIKRINNKVLKQIINGPGRIAISKQHSLKHKLDSLPLKVSVNYKKETVDTPENRFIKFALIHFVHFCGDFIYLLKDESKAKKEAIQIEGKLNQFLDHSIFKEISSLNALPLNSPILQRKKGYKEIFRTWLMFDLAAQLTWEGGNDIYNAGKKDVATLYEYWLFFILLDTITEIFKLERCDANKLVEKTNDGIGLKLKQGKQLLLEGVYKHGSRKLVIKFGYNRTFKGGSQYPDAGSWTSRLRPDYTLSIWPDGIKEEEAEKTELIVHIHFDAKYKIDNLSQIFQVNTDLEEEKTEQKKGTFKRADLLKMHTYKDAIRRTGGAYILYPGDDNTENNKRGYHEILPGIGAFSITPSKSNNGIDSLKNFLLEVINHFLNRASQREKMAFKTYEIYSKKSTIELKGLLPETIGINRGLIPDDTFIIIGYYKDDAHLKWILETELYNTRITTPNSPLFLNTKLISAKYLLLYSTTDKRTSKLYKLKQEGVKVYSKKDLLKKGYPSRPSQSYYLVFELDRSMEDEFKGLTWDIEKLKKHMPKVIGLPFAVSLVEIINAQ